MADWVDDKQVDEAFTEALGLLERTRAFVGTGTVNFAPADATPLDRIRMARDMSRLTSLATSCMGLVLLYQAVREGQMDRDEMQDDARRLFAELGAQLPDAAAPHPRAPELESLEAEGIALFARLKHLQRAFDTAEGGDGGGNGVSPPS